MTKHEKENILTLENIQKMSNQQYLLLIMVTTQKMGNPKLPTETIAQMQLTIHTATQIIAGRIKEESERTGVSTDKLMDDLTREVETMLEHNPNLVSELFANPEKPSK